MVGPASFSYMPTVSRRHHYVTRAYLEGFLEPTQTKLHCYGRGRSEPFCAAPVNLANIRDYHSFMGADGKPNDALERQIAETVESPGIQIIRKLSTGRNRLVRDERVLLAYLVALQRCRVPYEREFLDRQYQRSIIEMLEEMDGLAKQFGGPVIELESAVMATKEAPPPGAWKSIRRCDLESELRRTQADPRCFSRESFFVLARDLAMVFARMKWTVLYTSGTSHFITSDCPVAMTFLNTGIPHVGALRPDSEISFPLSRFALLKMQHDGVQKGMPGSFTHSMNTQKPKSNVSEIEQTGLKTTKSSS